MTMKLKYIFGGSGSGKTKYCIDEISGHGSKKLIYIVPEQFSLESEKSLITKNSGAIIYSQVLSFNRLSFHIMKKEGAINKKILEDNGKIMLLRKIIYNNYNDLNFFAKAADKEGFMDSLKMSITEFYKYCVSLDDLKAILDKLDSTSSMYLKISDIYLIYQKYIEFINKEYISIDETLDILTDKLDTSDFLQDAHIWIDSFHSFTPQEYRVIEKLLKYANEVNITINLKSNKTYYDDVQFFDSFYETKLTVNKITKIARDNNIEIIRPVYLNGSKRFPEKSALYHLEKNYLASQSPPYKGENPANTEIEIIRANNIYGEISEVTKKIHHLVSERNYRYRKFLY